MPYFVSWQNQKVTYEKYVGEKWKIHKTEWTEIRGWGVTLERVSFHFSRGSTQWPGRTQGESLVAHLIIAMVINITWNMQIITKTTKNERSTWCFSSWSPQWHPLRNDEELHLRTSYSISTTSRSSMCLQLGPYLALNDVALWWLSLDVSDSFCWRCDEQVPGSLQNPGYLLRALIDLDDLHHLHVSHHGDGLRCPELTLSFMILSNPCFHPCNLKYVSCGTNIPHLRNHSSPRRPPCSRL